MVCGSFFENMAHCIALKITQPRTFLTGARKARFNHKAQKEKSKPRETDWKAGLRMWRMMSDNGFNPPSSLWLQGSFQTDVCTHCRTFSNIKFYRLYRGWMEHLLGKVGKNGDCTAFLCKTQQNRVVFCHWVKNSSRMSSGWHVFQHSNSSLRRSDN